MLCESCGENYATKRSTNPDWSGYDLCDECAAEYDARPRVAQEPHYTIDSAKLSAIAEVAQMTEDDVRAFCLVDWPEGDEHQSWLDTAPAQEIASWIKAGR